MTAEPTLAAPADAERTQALTLALPANALPIGHRLRHFRIDALIGEGGFGIVYRATDTRLRRSVAIKEYMPAALAQRGVDLGVTLRSERCRATFDKGLHSFLVEAQTLAALERAGDALVEVYDYWEDNGSAYMVMRCYEGPTLKAWLQQQPRPPDEAWLRALLAPLLDVLERIHGGEPPCWHRDIAPDNILLLGPGRPLLLDFGAARRVIGDATQDLTVIFKPGYAPIEQYAESPTLRQGPWTDVYALCAVLRFALTGQTPPPSVNRLGGDTLVPLVRCAAGRCSPAFLAAIDAGMRVQPQERPQDMAALRALLLAPAAASSARTRRTLLFGGGTAALALLAGAAYLLRPRPAAAPVRAVLPPPPPPPPPVPPPPPAPPFSLAAAFDALVAGADPLRPVSVRLRQARLKIGRDALHYRIESAAAGHVYVFLAGADRAQLHLLFPEAIDRDNRIAAGASLALPRRGAPLIALGPAGTDLLLVLVSAVPRDFAEAGLQAGGEAFPAFDLARLEHAWSTSAGSARALLGRPQCDGAVPCDEGYGAALVQVIEEP